MNIVRSFANFLENRGYGTFGDDIFIGGAPIEADDVGGLCLVVVLVLLKIRQVRG